jgi:hypothetical protein
VPGAFGSGLSRTEFYDGMVLSEADMNREQNYWQMKRRLTNRSLGQGVVWGLSLQWDARSRCFTVCPGYGISCCGDDLVVECPEKVCEGDLIDPCSEDFRALLQAAEGPCVDPCDRRPDDPIDTCLMLEYVECPENPRQVFEDPCAELAGGCRFGAMRETTRLRLVPPSPPPPAAGSLERFCAKIETIKVMMAQEGLADAAEAAAAAAGQPTDAQGLPVVGLAATLADGAGAPISSDSTILPSTIGSQTALSFDESGAQRASISLVPPLGYGFLETSEPGGDTKTIETLMELSYIDNDITDDGNVARNPTVVLAPLAGGQAYEITYSLSVNHAGTNTSVRAEVISVTARERVKDCATLMQGWLFNVDPACATKTLLLAAVCGWFKGLLGSAACTPVQEQPDPTRVAIAGLICRLAWKILWKIETDEQVAQAERCLRKLFEDWCAEFHYKGPRCDHNKHGIILGCVQISPKGKILCFDEWKHRRYVLTGPLMSHWTGLFGIAPMDVMATRLASWICCVARTPDVAANADDIGDLFNQVMADNRLDVGGGFEIDTDFKSKGVFSGFAKRKTRALPVEQVEISLEANLARRIEARLEAAPVLMAPTPTLEMIREVSRSVNLVALEPIGGDEVTFDAAVAVMDTMELETAEDLLSLDVDLTARRIGATLLANGVVADKSAALRAVGLVQKSAMRTLEAATDAIIAEAKGREEDDDVFTRADFGETATSTAVRKAVNLHLRGRGLSAAVIKDIAKRVAER